MLFLNAGCLPATTIGPFTDATDADLEAIVNTNALHPIFLARVLLPQILRRDHKSALVVTSSIAAEQPIPHCLAYSCTKIFVSYLARGLSYELEGKVDCIDWLLGRVRTNMNKNASGPTCTTQEDCVHGILKQLGKMRSSHGCVTHDKQVMTTQFLSQDQLSRRASASIVKQHMHKNKALAAEK